MSKYQELNQENKALKETLTNLYRVINSNASDPERLKELERIVLAALAGLYIGD